MKHFSAQYIITNCGPELNRAIITTEDDGTIVSIKDSGDYLYDKQSIKFYNGVIIPGFVNCHCHLELSHMRGSIPRGTGLGDFLELLRSKRENDNENIIASTIQADLDMCGSGIVLCADICNTSSSFDLKEKSRVKYINLLEVFGIDPDKAERRLDEILVVSNIAEKMDLPFSIVPHSVYSMSLTLLRLLKEISEKNSITSIHFMETPGEMEFLKNHSGPLATSYDKIGLMPTRLETVKSHADAVMNEITLAGNLILVHNTFIKRKTIRKVKERGNVFWCLCPNSNIYIENKIPPLTTLIEEGCEIVIGTDSLASNNTLSIIDELKTLQLNFPSVSIEELVYWGTANGAIALGEEDNFGFISPGKKPGLLLLQDIDMLNMKLLPESTVTRLI